jgi:REP element-mobilizing transposase RayT
MPIPEKYLADFEEGGIYHVFNRTNGQEKLFLSDENHYFFLREYVEHLCPFLETSCSCLLPNHFHLLVKIKQVNSILSDLESKDHKDLTLTENKFIDNVVSISELTEQSFKRFFQSYARSFNKMYNRKGNLFYKPFKRVAVDKDTQLTQTIVYIHANPAKHNLIKDFTHYQWSSWKSLISEAPNQLLRQGIIEWFGNKSLFFVRTHLDMATIFEEIELTVED